MAETKAGEKLSQAHRLAQTRLAIDAMADIKSVWGILDKENLRDSFPEYWRVLQQLVNARRSESANAAAAYLKAFREAEGIMGALNLDLAVEIAAQRGMTSAVVAGPVKVKQQMAKGIPLEAASRAGLAATQAAMSRHIRDGGRDTIMRTGQRSGAKGWARLTDGRPCAFCAVIAARGAIYFSKSSASFEPHDDCGCYPELFYGDNPTLPEFNQKMSNLYKDATEKAAANGELNRGTSNDLLNAFRRAYEA